MSGIGKNSLNDELFQRSPQPSYQRNLETLADFDSCEFTGITTSIALGRSWFSEHLSHALLCMENIYLFTELTCPTKIPISSGPSLVVDFEPGPPTLTPFGDSDFLLFEEADSFLALEDDPTSSEVDPTYQDPEGDILLLEAIF
ncbi:hypothetical protein Tco_0914322 [Tanacetum coccineum]